MGNLSTSKGPKPEKLHSKPGSLNRAPLRGPFFLQHDVLRSLNTKILNSQTLHLPRSRNGRLSKLWSVLGSHHSTAFDTRTTVLTTFQLLDRDLKPAFALGTVTFFYSIVHMLTIKIIKDTKYSQRYIDPLKSNPESLALSRRGRKELIEPKD